MDEAKSSSDGKPIIIAIGHKAGVGKDTVGHFLVRLYGFHRIAFADKLKELTMEEYKLTSNEVFVDKDLPMPRFNGLTPRHFLQLHGDHLRNTKGDDVFVKYVKADIDAMIAQGRDVVVTDMRLPTEVAMLEELGANMWRIDRNVEHTGIHETEIALNSYKKWHQIIQNRSSMYDLFVNVVYALP